MTRKTRITGVHPCDSTAQVVTVVTSGGKPLVRREPCAECPWRKDRPVGAFPAEAYRASAPTAYDMATHTFACHMSSTEKPATCAGFLLSADAQHNLKVRIAYANGHFTPDDITSGVALYGTYKEMAVANGVAEDDPVLAPCRGDT